VVDSDDPVAVARALCAEGAARLHVVDLEGARTGRSWDRQALLEVIRSAPCPVQAGGGLSTTEDVEEVLAAGAAIALVGPGALHEGGAIAGTVARHAGRIGASIAAQGASLDLPVGGGVALGDELRAAERAGAGFLVFTDLRREGAMGGPDLDMLVRLCGLTHLPVIASGGVRSADDLRALARLRPHGVVGAVVGRALYGGSFTLAQAHAAIRS
jgi:phosphoribosylformimino-5-aminoimidazole carboxamide ribotide isomerase